MWVTISLLYWDSVQRFETFEEFKISYLFSSVRPERRTLPLMHVVFINGQRLYQVYYNQIRFINIYPFQTYVCISRVSSPKIKYLNPSPFWNLLGLLDLCRWDRCSETSVFKCQPIHAKSWKSEGLSYAAGEAGILIKCWIGVFNCHSIIHRIVSTYLLPLIDKYR